MQRFGLLLCFAGAVGIAAAGCATSDDVTAYQSAPGVVVASSAAVDPGFELADRLRQARRDLNHLRRTAETLRHQRDESGLRALAQFAEPHWSEHVSPLHAASSPRRDVLLPLDAGLWLAEAELWRALKRPHAVRRTLRGLEERFEGLESLVVTDPHGERKTLEQAVAALRRR
ncbi:MAG: hypothetical protein MJE66_05595 [Proteobacteria bacterium]|nr:hypothetical protein [Pseudomonadota bacterium]